MAIRHVVTAVGMMAVVGMAVAQAAPSGKPTLSYFGRATVKIKSASGFVVYIDPYAEGDYSDKADLILVTHGHDDHNAISMVTSRKPDVTIAAPDAAVDAKSYKKVKEGDRFTVGSASILVVPAYNKNHARGTGVGYVITVDGVVVYHSGDTSFIPEMAALASLKVDYALFPSDGYWNMGGSEVRKCADAVKARFVVPIHSSPNGVYDAARAATVTGSDVVRVEPKATITLEKR